MDHGNPKHLWFELGPLVEGSAVLEHSEWAAGGKLGWRIVKKGGRNLQVQHQVALLFQVR